jgi:hypothetical protein
MFRPRPRTASLVVALLALGAVSACNDYPVHRLLDSFEVRVTSKLNNADPVKLDFLWVIDHSTSMCQEQVALAEGFQSFITALQQLGAIDAQMGVVTVQQVKDASAGSGATLRIVNIGGFVHRPAEVFPPNCIESVRRPCTNDASCVNPNFNYAFTNITDAQLCPATEGEDLGFDALDGTWACDRPGSLANIPNINCSVNSACVSRCDAQGDGDSYCKGQFGPDAVCYVPGGTSFDDAGCMLPPKTQGCPAEAELPEIIGTDALDLFRCNSTVGTSTTLQAGFEGAFRSAWLALETRPCYCGDGCDPTPGEYPCDLNRCAEAGATTGCTYLDAPNCPRNPDGTLGDACQFNQLVRDDAYLVLVFVSDDDDCSVDPRIALTGDLARANAGLEPTKEGWRDCQRANDQLLGNKELMEGFCEFRRSKDANIYCPSDCVVGSDAKDADGNAKCAGGCALDSAERAACLEQADAGLGLFPASSSSKDAKFYAPVAEFVSRFKALKPDPAQVIVAAIVGDTVTDGTLTGVDLELKKQRDHVNYYHSLFADRKPGQAPYICAGGRGEAGYGSRYIQLAEGFGDNGVVQNICEGAGFGPALTNIANTILRRVVKVCLPQPPEVYTADEVAGAANATFAAGDPKIRVQRTRNGAPEELTFYANPTFDPTTSTYVEDGYTIAPSPDCRRGRGNVEGEGSACIQTRDCNPGLSCIEGRCQIYNDAIFFTQVPEPTDVIEINYRADLGL